MVTLDPIASGGLVGGALKSPALSVGSVSGRVGGRGALAIDGATPLGRWFQASPGGAVAGAGAAGRSGGNGGFFGSSAGCVGVVAAGADAGGATGGLAAPPNRLPQFAAVVSWGL